MPKLSAEKVRRAADLYGVDANTVSLDEVRRKWKQFSRKWHPDKNHGNTAGAEVKMKEYNDAFDVLQEHIEGRTPIPDKTKCRAEDTRHDGSQGRSHVPWKPKQPEKLSCKRIQLK